MRKNNDGWLGALRSLGQAGGELLRAELDALGSDLSASGASLARAIGFFLAAVFVIFWAIGALGYFSIELLALWLPRWSSALIVFVLLLIVVWILWMLAKRKLRQAERPTDTVRRRVADHLDWWQDRVLDGPAGERERLESRESREERE
ncbi:MAG: phage holin family protein [Acidobacteria bacterium]|nr:MAG: phage holin family protein [Acidobacteriota bacterium]